MAHLEIGEYGVCRYCGKKYLVKNLPAHKHNFCSTQHLSAFKNQGGLKEKERKQKRNNL